jgi:tetratricopeptide (TPR) repeat protein
MKNLFIALFFFTVLFFGTDASAQKAMLNKTVELIQSGDIASAKSAIDLASNEASTIEDPQTWYLKGYVYKELLKKDIGNFKVGHESLSALRKSINLDNENKYSEECLQVFQFIYFSWFNEGVKYFQEGNFKRSNEFLTEYNNMSKYFRSTSPNPLSYFYIGYNFKELGKMDSAMFYLNIAERSGVIEPTMYLAKLDIMKAKGNDQTELIEIISEGLLDNPEDQDLQITYINLLSEAGEYEKCEPVLEKFLLQNSNQADVLMMAGTVYHSLAAKKPEKSNYYFEKQKEVYTKAVKLQPNNQTANYNLGITYYNRGVDLIKGLSYDLELEDLKDAVEASSNLFLSAKPYMEKVYELNRKNENALMALISIYYNLNDLEKSRKIDQELSSIRKSN